MFINSIRDFLHTLQRYVTYCLIWIRAWWRKIEHGVDHDAVMGQVYEDGVISYRFAFMVVISAAIAMIGLLLNSAAVIIGAMLISPLMSPIMLAGVGISTLGYRMIWQSFVCILVGIICALGIAYLIVSISPIQDATPEILARTRPNLFDLAIAVLSGLAGGYAVIRGKGGAVVGVAIATALMPPLAVVGYGLASSQWALARGSSLLFLTNFIAIALSVSFVATWYGFSRSGKRREFVWQTAFAAVVLAPLILPLAISLKTIAHEAYVTRVARRHIEDALVDSGKSRIISFSVQFPTSKSVEIEAVIAVKKFRPELPKRVRALLQGAFEKNTKLSLDQITWGEAQSTLQVKTSGLVLPVSAPVPRERSWRDEFVAAYGLPSEAIEIDAEAKTVTIFAGLRSTSLRELRQRERELGEKFSEWKVAVMPALGALPDIFFERASIDLGQEQKSLIDDIVWALNRLQVKALTVIGYASTRGNRNQNYALRRAEVVSALFKEAGFVVEKAVNFPVDNQHHLEGEYGFAHFRKAAVLISNPGIE